MSRDTSVIAFRQPGDIDDPLTELAREGARRMLAQVLIAAADAFVARWTGKKAHQTNVKIVGELRQVLRGTENTLTVATQQGENHEVDPLYPALGCNVRSDLAGASSSNVGSL